jgi:hypothetical protein
MCPLRQPNGWLPQGVLIIGTLRFTGVLMNLIFRFIRFVVLSIFHLLIALISAIFRFLVLVVIAGIFRFVLWPFLVAVFRLLRDLLFLSFRATVNGPTRFIDRLAGEWTQRIFALVDDREHIHEVYQLCRLLVGVLVVLGWIIATLFTVEILRVVFGFLI